MESQLHRPDAHTHDQDSHTTGLHSDEGDQHHQEKTSVLNKVKARAKKMRDTFTKHVHGHEQEQEQEQEHEHERDYSHDDHDEDEKNDEAEAMVEDPEVHGAPINESAAIRSPIPAQNVNLEKPTAIGEDRYDGQRTDKKVGSTRPVLQGQSGENLGRPSAMEVVHAPEDKDLSFPPETYGSKGASGARKEDENVGRQGFGIGVPEGLEEDQKNRPGATPPSNYETKVTDPTGNGGEVGINPLLRSFHKMGVYDESVPKSEAESGQKGYTGSHDQFAPETYPTEGKFDPKTPRSYDPSKPEEDLPRDDVTGKSSDKSGYVEKIAVATSIVPDKAISAKNVVTSRLGYGGSEGGKAEEKEAGSHDQFAPETKTTEGKFDPKTSTPRSYDPSKPEDLPRDTVTGKSSDKSGYVEKISVATSIIADKAISAKNVVASRLGYGGSEGGKAEEKEESKDAAYTGSHDQFAPETNPTEGKYDPKTSTPRNYDPSKPEDLPRDTVTGKSSDKSGYVEKISVATSIIADKAISAKNVVASRLGYGGSEGGKAEEKEESKDAAKSGASPTGHQGAEMSGESVPDKVASVKEYLAEKLKPGEEDKALSEVISDSLHKKREESGKTVESKPIGKVTESEEVAKHLGTGMERKREGDDAIAAGRESSGKSVVDRLKGAVSSWIVKGGEDQQYSQGSADSSYVSNEGSATSDEIGHPRLQESSN